MALLSDKQNQDKDKKKVDKKSNVVKAEKKTASTKKSEDKKETGKKQEKSKISLNAYKVLIRPLITEKINRLKEENKYVFEVAYKANKIEIAKAINEIYKVKPTSVNIIRVIGKRVRRGRVTGKRKDWKKAIISLPKGKGLDIYKT